MNLNRENIGAVADHYKQAMIEFARHIVATPSIPGSEGEVAAIISHEMNELAYDEVWTDHAGNVIGKIKGGDGPSIMLNGHMDHVDSGPPEGWPYHPFSAEIIDGELWGRASVDMKGPVACMIYAASLFKPMGVLPPGDVYVTIAVMEEIGGLGTRYLVTHLNTQIAICGEPSNNILRRGHRGRVELMVEIKGRSAHASAPHLGANPHYGAAAFLQNLPTLNLAEEEELKSSSVVPTLYSTDQFSPNVIPNTVYLTLDWRNVPSETPEEIVYKIKTLLDRSLTENCVESGLQGTVEISRKEFTTYTGMTKMLPSIFPAFLLPEHDPFLKKAHQTISDILGRDGGIDLWRFATDGGHLMTAGIPTIGFGPGDETLAHTNQERISLTQMEEALMVYTALIYSLPQVSALK